MAFVTRFAPSPTGPLHLGHAYSAMLAHDMARANSGSFLLRIEDIDPARSRPEWEAQLIDDLHWLGVKWDAAPMRQSGRLAAYQLALDDLWQRDLLYPCTCSRRDIDQALAAPQEGVPLAEGPDGPIYPGTCVGRHCGGLPCSMLPRPMDRHLRLAIGIAAMNCDHNILQPGRGIGGFGSRKPAPAMQGLCSPGGKIIPSASVISSWPAGILARPITCRWSWMMRHRTLPM